jgi:hypothetical protein
MATVKTLAAEYISTYSLPDDPDSKGSVDEMVYHFLHDLSHSSIGTPGLSAETELTDEQEAFLREQMKAYAEND